MAYSRRFIQFSHPGAEHGTECGSVWHRSIDERGRNHRHQRKFMQFDGRWIAENGDEHGDELWAWANGRPNRSCFAISTGQATAGSPSTSGHPSTQ